MAFFETSGGEALEAETSFKVGGIQTLIPEGLKLLSTVTGVIISPRDNNNNEHIVIELMVTQECKYKDFTINHKLQVNDDKPEKKDKAIKMLLSYDSNASGLLRKADKAGNNIMDVELLNSSLNGTEIVANYAVYEMAFQSKDRDTGEYEFESNGDRKMINISGNWCQGISPKTEMIPVEDQDIIDDNVTLQQTRTPDYAPTSTAVAGELVDDDIPF